jgi:hypothetical protein
MSKGSTLVGATLMAGPISQRQGWTTQRKELVGQPPARRCFGNVSTLVTGGPQKADTTAAQLNLDGAIPSQRAKARTRLALCHRRQTSAPPSFFFENSRREPMAKAERQEPLPSFITPCLSSLLLARPMV